MQTFQHRFFFDSKVKDNNIYFPSWPPFQLDTSSSFRAAAQYGMRTWTKEADEKYPTWNIQTMSWNMLCIQHSQKIVIDLKKGKRCKNTCFFLSWNFLFKSPISSILPAFSFSSKKNIFTMRKNSEDVVCI